MEIGFILLAIAIVFVIKSVKVVPQQHAWVVERLGKYNGTLTPGLNFLMPFIDRVAYKHVLKEIPLDIPSQVCITRDNTQLQVDGILYFQVTDAMRASYGSSNYIMAISQLAQTSLRSVIGKLELDKTFEERDIINAQVVQAIEQLLLANLHSVLPKSLLGQALHYTAGQWHKLKRYVEDGRYSIDNNVQENAIRPFCVGRRNWLFADTVAGAHASANLYSLLQTCRVNGIDGYRYLRSLFEALPTART